MLKKLTIIFLLVGLGLAIENSPKIANQMTKTLCSKTITKQIEEKEQIAMLTRCLNQKHQSESVRSPRSIDLFSELFNMDSIIDQLKKMTTGEQSKKSIGNMMIGITEIDLRPETPNKIRCDSKLIRIESAVLSSKDFETQCEQTKQNENLNALNETCHDEQQALKIAAEACNGKRECELNIETLFEGVCDCTAKKYLKVAFSCVKPSEIQMSRNKRALFYRNDQASIDRDRAYRRSFGNIYDDYYYNYFYPYDYYPYDYYPYDFYPYDFYPYDFYPYDFYPYDYTYGFANPLAAKQQTQENSAEKASNLKMKIRKLNLESATAPLDAQKPVDQKESTKDKGFSNFQWKLDREALKQKLQSVNKNRKNENQLSVNRKNSEANPNPNADVPVEARKSQGKFNFKANRNEARRKNPNQDSLSVPPQSPRSQTKPRHGATSNAQARRKQNSILPNSNKFANRHVQE